MSRVPTAAETQLTEQMLVEAAGETVAGRGEGYVRYVRGLRVVGTTVHATIQARNVYLVELDWKGGELDGACTCPNAARGAFCKHQVAVGYCVIDRTPRTHDAADVEAGPSKDPVAVLLDALPPESLRDLVAELMERDPAVFRLVELRAASCSGDPALLAEQLVETVNDTLSGRGFVDYRRSFEVAREAEDLLDQLERQLESGPADAVRPALLRATTRLQKLTLNADDSGGVIGSACQRALDLYARSCREGTPDGPKLARWLVKFRDESPGWPHAELADFVGAFDQKALTAYRRAVQRLYEKYDGEDRWQRVEVDRMRLELADHDGDVDQAVQILNAGESPSYGAIVERLRRAGRHDEAVSWIDRAVAEKRVSGHGGGNDFWLAPDDVARTYLALGRVDEAVRAMRGEFLRAPSAATFKALVDFAAPLDRGDSERQWALDQARERATEPFGSGGVLVEIALREGDLDTAWQAARDYGPGHLWQPLSDASASTYPREAADLYLPGLQEDLRFADTQKYAGIAQRLARMRDLYHAAGDVEDFAELISEVRETYGRRPSLMAALDRRQLP